jgi:anion-transporting  ArsA/GET3 family ATPase
MSDLFEKQLVVVAGKGGVGRTTLAMVVGRCASRRGKRTLVCLSNAPLRYLSLLGGVSLGANIRQVGDRLHVVNLEPRAAREEYGLMVLKNRTLHRLVFGSRMVRAFLDAVPGLAEWAMLGKATHHALREVDGRPEYDLVVLDSPATGHGIDVLSLPRAIVSAVPSGRMREEANRRVQLMEDPERCEVLPVTIAEEMAVNEAVELIEALRGLDLPIERLVVNMVQAVEVGEALERSADRIEPDEEIPSWLLPTAAVVSSARVQAACIARLEQSVAAEIIRLPLIGGGSLDEASLLEIASAFYGELTGASSPQRGW